VTHPFFPDDVPNRTAYDIEIAKDIPKGSDGRLNWNAVKKGRTGISTIAFWNTQDIAPMVGIMDRARFPRIAITEHWVGEQLARCEGLVSWNGAGFDNPVVVNCVPAIGEIIDSKKCVDLMAIMALLKTNCDPAKLENGVSEDWMKMAPRIGKSAHGWINAGFGLDAVSKATLGEWAGKVAGFDGAKVIKAWQGGRYSEVASYNIGDTALTILLYCFAWEHGHLVSPSQGRVDIPRNLL
jgi:predicted PolB exonuclease-like 3'-5' exonuclease